MEKKSDLPKIVRTTATTSSFFKALVKAFETQKLLRTIHFSNRSQENMYSVFL